MLDLNNPSQSSTYSDKYPATKALDGGLTMIHSKLAKGCAVTLNQANPWWKAELKQLSSIKNVNIMPRQDCCKINYNNVTVSTSLDGKMWTLCEDLGDKLSQSNTWVKATCPAGTVGRYIKFVQYNSKAEFAVCEVEAFGYPSGTTKLGMSYFDVH